MYNKLPIGGWLWLYLEFSVTNVLLNHTHSNNTTRLVITKIYVITTGYVKNKMPRR